MARQTVKRRNPWAFVPTLYFAEGLPYILINVVSVVLYKRMGIDNARIAFWTSSLYLPWVIKMFWGPLVDIYSTKRNWILTTQFVMGLCLFLVAIALRMDDFFALSLAAFALGAFISATHDIATDGFYMLSLTTEEQALFVGIRATFYRFAMIFGSGFLVYLAGRLETLTGIIPFSWMLIMAATAFLFIFFFLYHKLVLPYPDSDTRRNRGDASERGTSFLEIISSYFRQEKILAIVAFILLYRTGEAMLVKLVSPFLLDPPSAGGLGLSTEQVGLVYGTIGIAALVVGGILGGWLIATFGLRRCIWPMALALNVPNLFYVYLASAQPSIALVYLLVAAEQFGYGIGFTAFMVYLMYAARGRFKTSHFAISTGIMALGMMLPGMVSGFLQKAVGYQLFFIIVFLLTIPGMLTILVIPKLEGNEEMVPAPSAPE